MGESRVKARCEEREKRKENLSQIINPMIQSYTAFDRGT
jgi:hypothetical protein